MTAQDAQPHVARSGHKAVSRLRINPIHGDDRESKPCFSFLGTDHACRFHDDGHGVSRRLAGFPTEHLRTSETTKALVTGIALHVDAAMQEQG